LETEGSIMKKLLAAVDFSPVSKAIAEQAASLAKAFSAELVLIHVAAPDPDFVGYDAGPQTVRDGRADELREEHKELQALADGLRDRGLSARALLIQGPTVEKILAEGERLGADVIVVGSHGHGALHRVLLGSVSEGVVRGARCPVLVVPAPGPESA
jgi:nucleotide-binding universal stress UspA family protein